MVSDRPFIAPVQQTTGVTSQKQSTSAPGQMEIKKATQPVEAPSSVSATQPVEAPGASTEVQLTGQDASPFAAADKPEVLPVFTYTSGHPISSPQTPLARLLLMLNELSLSLVPVP